MPADPTRGQRAEDLVAEAASDALSERQMLQVMLSAAAGTLPSIDRAGARVAAACELARVYIRAAADLHDALARVAPDAARITWRSTGARDACLRSW
jgi:hypothetical protein